jgi:ferric-dicitrate binding protein FerR (iron transport regulator)
MAHAHDEQALKKLGRQVGDALGTGPDASRREAQRRAVVGYLRAGGQTGARPRRALTVAAAGLAAAAAAVALWLVLRPAPQSPTARAAPIAFEIEGQGAGQVGHWIEARGQNLVIRFEGGTRMDLGHQSRAQVTRADEQRVAVRLDHGALRADVKQRRAAAAQLTTWDVEAGPYQVTVLGTRFRVRWDAPGGALLVAVNRGRVRVTGEGLDSGGVLLTAGQQLQVDRRTSRYTVAPVASASGADSVGERGAPPRVTAPDPGSVTASDSAPDVRVAGVPQDSADSPTARPARISRRPGASAARPDTARTTPAWQRLLRQGRHADAVRAAERVGIARLAATLPAGPLWRLATAGRIARRGATAQALLEAYRRRFSHSTNAHTAAFLLGRVAMELRGQPARAARWFRRYLRDAPTGPLAEEALGRYVDACRRAGQRTEARAAARRYLARYPQGTFRRLARSVLGQ